MGSPPLQKIFFLLTFELTCGKKSQRSESVVNGYNDDVTDSSNGSRKEVLYRTSTDEEPAAVNVH